MKYCSHCGVQLSDDQAYCSSCGAPADNQNQNAQNFTDRVSQQFNDFNNTPNESAGYSAQDIDKNKPFAVLAYLYLLVLVPIFAAKDSAFARFHANQGLTLSIFYTGWILVSRILSVVFAFVWPLFVVLRILDAAVGVTYIVFVVLGIVNAAQGQAKELPLIGGIRILK